MKHLSLLAGLLVASASTAMAVEPIPYYNPCEDITTITWVRDVPPYNTQDWHQDTYGSGNQANPAFSYVPGYKPSSLFNLGSTVFTKELDLQTGKAYKLTFVYGSWYTAPTMRNYVKFNVALYKEPKYEYKDDSNLFTEIFVKSGGDAFNSTGRPSYTVYFKGDSERRYVGFGNRGGGNVTRVGIDDILIEEIDINTPGTVSNFNATVNGREVNIGFTLPSSTLLGDRITNIESVKILRDGKVVKEFTSQTPGVTLTYTDTTNTAADYTYSVVCGNGGTYGDPAVLTVKVPLVDNTLPPTIKQEYGKDPSKTNGNFGFNYKAHAIYVPGEGVKIKYSYPLTEYYTSQIPEGEDITSARILRITDGKFIANEDTSGELLDNDIDVTKRRSWQYQLDLKRYTNTESVYSSIVSLNNPLPFNPGISSGGLNEFTIIDEDGDNTSWSFMSKVSDAHYHGGLTDYYTCSKNVQGNANGRDWLITPGFNVEQGKTYRIDVTTFANEIIEAPVQIIVAAGRSNTAEGMTDTIIAPFKFTHMTPKEYSAYYNPAYTENAFFGIGLIDSSGNLGLSDWKIYEVSGLLPEAVDIINVSYSAEPGYATLSFNAPVKAINGSDLTSLDKIELYRNGELVDTFVSPAPGALLTKEVAVTQGRQDEYQTVPYTAAGPGLPTEVKVMVIEPPYSNSFDKASDMTGFTVIDPQERGYTWGYMGTGKYVRSYPDRESGQDDYLITPPIHLEKGYFYKIDFSHWLDTEDTNNYYNNQMEVLLGKAPTREALTDTVIAPFYIRGGFNSRESAKEWFTVSESGEYYIAWHAMAQPYLGREIYLDDINISAKIPGTYPGAPEEAAIVPDQEGGLEVGISFNIPAHDMLGGALAENVHKTVLLRDGKQIKEWTDQTPGTSVTLKDSGLTEGVHHYTLTSYGYDQDSKADVPTRDLDVNVFVGLNKPAWVSFIKAEENPHKYGEVTITWGAPESDKDGYPLNTNKIYYTVGQAIYNPLTGSTNYAPYVENNLFSEGLTYTVDTKVTKQQFMKFYVDAATAKHDETEHEGECSGGLSEYMENITPFMAIGAPYELPFVESFPNSNSSHGMMGQELDGIAMWGFNTDNRQTGVKPVDGDRGLALMEGAVANGSSARLHTGRILLDAEHPLFTIYLYNNTQGQYRDTNEFRLSIREGMGEFEPVAVKSIDEWTDGALGWHKIGVDLSEYAGKTVYIGLEGIAHRFYSYPGEEELISFIHVDNMKIQEAPTVDASVRSVNNTTAYVGTQHTVSVAIRNNGAKTLDGAEVILKLDGEEIDSKTAAPLEPGEIGIVTFLSTIGHDRIGTHKYSAEVKAEGDADLLDNSAEGIEFSVRENAYPTVVDLKAHEDDLKAVIEWTAPFIPENAITVTDDFEDYESWSTMHSGIGDYTLIDADGLGVGGIQNGMLPIEVGSKQSFTLWDFTIENEEGLPLFGADSRYSTHSGDKCLVSMLSSLNSYTDDRLISPLLTGEAQTISFYAKALAHAYPENFQVYYSKEGIEFQDFQPNFFKQETVTGDWTEYRYQLPEGTKYFMIRHYSKGGYFLFLDDLTYTPLGNERLELKGYNVYRDNAKLNESPIASTSWTDSDATKGKIYRYGVTAVYDLGESPIEDVILAITGIDGIDGSIRIYSEVGEIVIEGAEGVDFAVTDTAGLTVKAGIGSSVTHIRTAAGIYLVSVGGKTVKVVVR